MIYVKAESFPHDSAFFSSYDVIAIIKKAVNKFYLYLLTA